MTVIGTTNNKKFAWHSKSSISTISSGFINDCMLLYFLAACTFQDIFLNPIKNNI